MTVSSMVSDDFVKAYTKAYGEILKGEITKHMKTKEKNTMQVTYNGFTGELVKLERLPVSKGITAVNVIAGKTVYQETEYLYALSIYDEEKNVTHSFTNIKLEDVKFLGGAVTFGE